MTDYIIRARDGVLHNAIAEIASLVEAGKIADVRIKEWKHNRSIVQNRVFHMWAEDVSNATGEPRHGGRLKLQYFVPILLREDEQWAWVWKQTGAKLSYAKQIEFLGLPNMLGCTSRCNAQQFSEALNALWSGEAHLGLRNPLLYGYE